MMPQPQTPPVSTAGIAGIAEAWSWTVPGPEPLGSLAPRPLAAGITVAICTMSRPESIRLSLESILDQSRRPDQLVIVDASSGDDTERVVRAAAPALSSSMPIVYARVERARAGLTRQRNLALALTERKLVAFFDDDVVLRCGCLEELERAHRDAGPGVVGVGGHVERLPASPAAIWRLRRWLGVVGTLEPGRYCRSGMSTPWSLGGRADGIIEGDWLPGYAMMWETALARELGFDEGLAGYAQSEDLEFSLRARRRGKLVLACAACVADAHALAGRPDAFRMGYMAIYNRFLVHRRLLADRKRRDVALFAYAWTVDTLLLARHLIVPSRFGDTLKQIAGRLRAGIDLAAGR